MKSHVRCLSTGTAITTPDQDLIPTRRLLIALAALTPVWLGLTACTMGPRTSSRGGAPLHARMSDEDLTLADQTVQRALEHEHSGTVLVWRNASTGHSGSVEPMRTYRTADGTYCREYREEMRIGADSETYETIACRNASGSWQPI